MIFAVHTARGLAGCSRRDGAREKLVGTGIANVVVGCS
jgi:hypothetical protein